jgi:hypothetical protein
MKAFTFLINQKVCMVRHGASHKIKCFKVFLYTGSKAKTRCDFGKDQGLARRKGKKERVTPEFGERKEEKKFYHQIQGVTVCRKTVRLLRLSSHHSIKPVSRMIQLSRPDSPPSHRDHLIPLWET